MKLGILVNTDKHLEHILGLTKAAIGKNHEVIVFIMDEGTRLLQDDSFVEISKLQSVTMSVCEHSAKHHGVNTEGLSGEITCGSQLNNAMMNKNADRVVVL